MELRRLENLKREIVHRIKVNLLNGHSFSVAQKMVGIPRKETKIITALQTDMEYRMLRNVYGVYIQTKRDFHAYHSFKHAWESLVVDKLERNGELLPIGKMQLCDLKDLIQRGENMTKTGELLRINRLKKGVSQVEMAEELRVTVPFVSQCEIGKSLPPNDSVEKWARSYGVHITDLAFAIAQDKQQKYAEKTEKWRQKLGLVS